MKKLTGPAIILLVFLLDRASKHWALKALYMKSVKVLSFFHLTYAENTGVAFGMFRDSNLFFLVFSSVLISVLLYLRRRIEANGALASLGLALVLGGALGNLYDRIAYGFVVDYFDFSFFPAVFNVADSAITVGAALMALGMKDEKVGSHGSGVGEQGAGSGETMRKIILFALLAAGLAGCNRSPEFYFERGNHQFAAGKESEALESYNKALVLKRNFPEAFTSRGLLYERQGDRQKAGLDYRKAMEMNASYLPAYNNLGALLMDGGNYREAVKLFTVALAVKPDYSFALLNRGLSLYKMDDCAGAVADLSRALELNNKLELAYYHRALCARKARNLPAALADLDAIIAVNPAAALALFERGKAMYYIKDYSGAAQEFAKAVELKQEDPVYLYWLSLALYKSDNPDGALEMASRAAALKPDSYQFRGLMGDIYSALKDKENAGAQYLLAAELSPKYASVYKARLAALRKPAAPAKKRRR